MLNSIDLFQTKTMAANKHVFLKNDVKINDGFKKTRNIQGENNDEEEAETLRFPNQSQQDRLRRANAIFFTERKARNEKRSVTIPVTIELILIRFYKIINERLLDRNLKSCINAMRL